MDNQKEPLKIGTPRCGLLLAIAGAVIALMLLYIGFWRTVFVLLFAAGGYMLGAVGNKSETIKRIVNKLFPPKGE